jgi:hypothetical protein
MIDTGAALRGATVAFAVALAASLAQLGVRGSPLALVFLVAVLGGFVAGGFRAATLAGDAPLTTAAVAAAGAFVAAQAIVLVVARATGATSSGSGALEVAVGIAFSAMLATSCGLLGAILAGRRRPAT